MIAGVRRWQPSAHVIAVEAIPEKAQRLRARFPEVEVHECAVGDEDGSATFYVDVERSGYSSLSEPAGARTVRRIDVRLARLDTLVDRRDVDVIKVDVEGAELQAMCGGEALIAACHPTTVFESGIDEPASWRDSKAQLWRWFTDHGYDVLVPNRVAHDGAGLTLDGFLEAHLYPRRATNYFAIASERRAEIREAARVILQARAD